MRQLWKMCSKICLCVRVQHIGFGLGLGLWRLLSGFAKQRVVEAASLSFRPHRQAHRCRNHGLSSKSFRCRCSRSPAAERYSPPTGPHVDWFSVRLAKMPDCRIFLRGLVVRSSTGSRKSAGANLLVTSNSCVVTATAKSFSCRSFSSRPGGKGSSLDRGSKRHDRVQIARSAICLKSEDAGHRPARWRGCP